MAERVCNQPLTRVPNPIGSLPIRVICPSCQADVETTIVSTPSTMGYILGLRYCLLA